MPLGWRLPARSHASPHACATDPATPIPPAIADAFVDRAPIDWTAVLARARDGRSRAVLEALRRLDALRGHARHGASPGPAASQTWLGVLVAIAALHTAAGFAIAAAAWSRAGSTGWSATPILIAATFASAALLLAAASSRDRRVLLLAATFMLAACAFARALVNGLGPDPRLAGSVVFRGVFPEAFIPAALWRFAVGFPLVYRFTRFDVWARRAASLSWILACGLFAANVALAYGWFTVPLSRLRRDAPGNLFWDVFTAAALPAFAAIFVRACRSPSSERAKAFRFGAALAAGAGPLLIMGLARMASPRLNQWMTTSGGELRFAIDTITVAALAAMPVLATLAIVADRPFELGAARSPAFPRWFGVRALWAGRRRRDQLSIALEHIRLARGSREIALVLSRALQDGVDASTAVVIDVAELPEESGIRAIVEDARSPVGFARDSALLPLLPVRDREWLEAQAAELAAPVRLRGGTIAAVVLLGPRRGRTTYDRSDCWFIGMLVTAAATAWNAAAEDECVEEAAFECPRCGILADAQPLGCQCAGAAVLSALPRWLAGTFTVLRRIGAGGMGVVYLARDEMLNRAVALKTLPALHEGSVARLRDEARAMAALSHPALATIYGLEVWRGTPVLVVEFCPGGTLADRLAAGPLDCADVVALGVRLADALSYMHSRGVLHRDLKPGNIGLDAHGTAKLLDFGLSIARGVPGGTLAYLPPEALTGAQPDEAIDLWGLAAVLLEAGGGKCGALAPFFTRALAIRRDDRFQSSAEMRDALLALRR